MFNFYGTYSENSRIITQKSLTVVKKNTQIKTNIFENKTENNNNKRGDEVYLLQK